MDNAMLRQVRSLPDLILGNFDHLEKVTHTILTTPEIFSVKKVFLIGSGDSYAAALAVKNTFEKFLTIPIVVLDPLDCLCYEQMRWVGESPLDPLVIAISNSGMPKRLVEAITHMRNHNALTIAVTNNPESPVAKACERVVELGVPKFEPCPGVRSYGAILTALYLMAMRFGAIRLKVRIDDNMILQDQFKAAMNWLRDDYEVLSEKLMKFATENRDCVSAEFLGSGPDFGTAWYAHEKSYEAMGIPANFSNTENWFHLNYFLRDTSRTLTIVFDSLGNESHPRTAELIKRMNEMGRNFLVVADYDVETANLVKVPSFMHSFAAPFIEWVIPAMVIAMVADMKNEVYSRGFEGIWKEGKDSFNTVNTCDMLED